jgi:DNA mismatch repair protein MutH
LERARRLAGRPLWALASSLGEPVPEDLTRAKGWVGQLLEKALGATASSRAVPDFEALGVELKTLPVDGQGQPRESTFVATLDMEDFRALEWVTSSVRKKLLRVLWLPVEAAPAIRLAERRVGAPLLWSPTLEQEASLREDFECIVEQVEAGFDVTGHAGRHLQLRPKGADSQELRWAFGPEFDRVRAAPRAFYLRPAFTGALIRENYALAFGG